MRIYFKVKVRPTYASRKSGEGGRIKAVHYLWQTAQGREHAVKSGRFLHGSERLHSPGKATEIGNAHGGHAEPTQYLRELFKVIHCHRQL